MTRWVLKKIFKNKELSKAYELGAAVERLRSYRHFSDNIVFGAESNLIEQIEQIAKELKDLGIEVQTKGLY